MRWVGRRRNDAEAVLRSLPSLVLRYRAQDETARCCAAGSERPEVAQLLHPAFEASPGIRTGRQCAAATAQRRACFRWSRRAHSVAKVDAFCDA
jgi:cystathionine beta-lyase